MIDVILQISFGVKPTLPFSGADKTLLPVESVTGVGNATGPGRSMKCEVRGARLAAGGRFFL